MIALDTLTKRFGGLLAVDDLSLSVARGEVLGFLGPNGAGKTTTMRMISGFIQPTSGRVTVCGFDIARDSIEVKRRIGYLPEGAPLYGDMPTHAFLRFVAAVRGLEGLEQRNRIAAVVEQVSLEDVLDRPLETLSKGFKRRVGLAQAMLHDPEVLILDEPTDGLDPNQKHHVRALIRDMAKDKAIIISTHILEEVESVCTRATIISNGRIVADGTADSLLQRLPRHNAVRVAVPAAETTRTETALRDTTTPMDVEWGGFSDGLAVFFIRATDGKNRLAEIARVLHGANLTVEALSIERGSLDAVFRNLTTQGGETTHNGAEGVNGAGGE
ncbi:MAG: ABC transporter ATP-binding protein [Hyphomicrobiales bacterium]|nr:ABC transporter ATP-binding protein [Hyphomicrobiales bacterium]